MATKKFRPITPVQRTRQVLEFKEITKKTPEKSLVAGTHKTAGRNNSGRITVRHRGGGVRQKYRIIDFRREKDGVKAAVVAIEYDPFRSSHIALLSYRDGEKRYILAPVGLKVGMLLESGPDADIKVGNALPLENIPVGSVIHNVELSVRRGGQMARSAGASVVLMAKNDEQATLKLPSGEIRLVNVKCRATLGQVGNEDHRNQILGKAGATRKLGRRPQVRGSVMNPCDHPHGGGEGKAPIGRPGPVTPWGKPALGYKTRSKRHRTNRLIIKRRK